MPCLKSVTLDQQCVNFSASQSEDHTQYTALAAQTDTLYTFRYKCWMTLQLTGRIKKIPFNSFCTGNHSFVSVHKYKM